MNATDLRQNHSSLTHPPTFCVILTQYRGDMNLCAVPYSIPPDFNNPPTPYFFQISNFYMLIRVPTPFSDAFQCSISSILPDAIRDFSIFPISCKKSPWMSPLINVHGYQHLSIFKLYLWWDGQKIDKIMTTKTLDCTCPIVSKFV
jgi:hypothetical protein